MKVDSLHKAALNTPLTSRNANTSSRCTRNTTRSRSMVHVKVMHVPCIRRQAFFIARERVSPCCQCTASPGKESKGTDTETQTEAKAQKSGKEQLDTESAAKLDKLISVFKTSKESSWIKMIAQSRQWKTISNNLFERIDTLVEGNVNENEVEELKKLSSKLKSLNQELSQKSTLLRKLTDAQEYELQGLVALHYQKLDDSFYEYVRDAIASYKGDQEKQEEIATRMSLVISLYEAQKDIEEDGEKLKSAAENFSKILGAESLSDAEKEIDGLVDAGNLDPALMTMMAKAWAGAKESDMMKEEAKDVMFHLYNKAREGLSHQQPVELKILKHVVSQHTAREKRDALEEAFTPGLNYETSDTEYLSTTPEKLISTVESVLNTYEMQRMRYIASSPSVMRAKGADITGSDVFSGMMLEAETLNGPNVIKDLREIKYLIRKEFLSGQKFSEEGELWMG